MKIVFFGSTNLGLPLLEALIKTHEVVGVVTTPDAKAGRKQELQETPVSSLAKDLKLNLLKPEKLKDEEFLNTLKSLDAEVFVLVAYGKIIPNQIIDLPKYKIVNLHPSLLPKYRGPSPIRNALLNGDEYTGITFILLDDQVDHGPIIGQQVVKIDDYDNDFTLTNKLGQVGGTLINEIISDYVTGKITPLPQDDSAATFTSHFEKQHGKIDWNKTANQIYNQFRAFYPWPGIWTEWNGKKLKITDCSVVANEGMGSTTNDNECGRILEGGTVVCGQNTLLKIKSLQLEGKNETDIDSFLNGYSSFIGSQLK